MEDIIKQAIDFRKAAKYQESRALLETLLNDENYAAKEGANKSYGTRAFTGNPLILND